MAVICAPAPLARSAPGRSLSDVSALASGPVDAGEASGGVIAGASTAAGPASPPAVSISARRAVVR